jgi:iron complex transport system substrate-binding protein
LVSALGRVAGALLATVVMLSGCRAHPHAETSGPAHRIVSLSPSTTEALATIGAGKLLVGRSRYCNYPAEVVALPEVGGYVDPNYEAILALAPDLVTGARGPAGPGLSTRLEARGIATYFPETESLDGIDAMLRGLGVRTGHRSEAEAVIASLHDQREAVVRAVATEPRVRVLLLFGITPIVAAGPGSFPDELVRLAGASNVVAEGGAYPTLGFEHVLALDPDVVVDAAWGENADGARLSATSAGWKELRAVKGGHVIPLRDEAVLRPGPRIGEGLTLLAHALHPGVSIAQGARR